MDIEALIAGVRDPNTLAQPQWPGAAPRFRLIPAPNDAPPTTTRVHPRQLPDHIDWLEARSTALDDGHRGETVTGHERVPHRHGSGAPVTTTRAATPL
ncbi:MAG: hypothetical protein ACRD0K_16670 [Egibacteraceae bacterium]